jgi:anti-sigma regulatory factor (Ser/Thr protein kinase)
VDPEVCEDARLIATELVANVVDHAGTDCTLTLSLDGDELRMEVRDFYPCPAPRPRPFDMHARRGRGLQVVSMLSIQCGVNEFTDGKSVWAALSATPVPSVSHTAALHRG